MSPTLVKGKAEESLVVGMDESEFVAGGLPTDFDGRVKEARTCIWNYDNGNGPKMTKLFDTDGNEIGEEPVLTLAVKVIIERTDGEPDVPVYYSAGDPASFAPSMDGKTPSPADEAGCSEGINFIRVGSKSALNNNTNYAQFLQALADAETAAPHLKRARTSDIRFLEGLFGHWERIPQKKRAGVVKAEPKEGQQARVSEVLVVTQVKADPGAGATTSGKKAPAAAPAAKAPAGKTPATTPAATASVAASGDLDSKVQEIVKAAVVAAGDEGIAKGKLAKKILEAKSLTQPEKAKAVPLAGKTEFLEAGFEAALWMWDAENGMLFPYPAEE